MERIGGVEYNDGVSGLVNKVVGVLMAENGGDSKRRQDDRLGEIVHHSPAAFSTQLNKLFFSKLFCSGALILGI